MLDDKTKQFNYALSYDEFKMRLDSEPINEYWRISELVKIMNYKDRSSVRDFCIQHNIPRYKCKLRKSNEESTRECVCFCEDIRSAVRNKELSCNFVTQKHPCLITENLDVALEAYFEQITAKTKTSRTENFSLPRDLLSDMKTLQYQLYTRLICAYQHERKRYRLECKRNNVKIPSLPYPRRNKANYIDRILFRNDLKRLLSLDINEDFRHVLSLIEDYQNTNFFELRTLCEAIDALFNTEGDAKSTDLIPHGDGEEQHDVDIDYQEDEQQENNDMLHMLQFYKQFPKTISTVDPTEDS